MAREVEWAVLVMVLSTPQTDLRVVAWVGPAFSRSKRLSEVAVRHIPASASAAALALVLRALGTVPPSQLQSP